jgi:hypothetical protein
LDRIGSDNGTVTASQGDSVGVAGNAYYFNGTTDYVQLGTGINYGTNNLSGCVWLFPHSLDADFRIYSGEDNSMFIYYHAAGDGIAIGKTGVDVSITTDMDLTVNAWNHVAWSNEQAEDSVRFWIDGAWEVEEWAYEYGAVTNYIGSDKVPGSFYPGLMDDLFLWDGDTLTQGRVDSIYNAGPPGRRYNESGGGQAASQDSIKSSFTVNTDIGSHTVDSVFVNNTKVRLELDSDVAYGATLTVDYDKPVTYGLRDSSNNYTVDWSALAVTNQVDSSATFEIYAQHDFETEDLGAWSTAEQEAYFDVVGNISWPNNVTIVMDTINDTPTQVLRFTHPANTLYGYELIHDYGTDREQVYLSYNYKFDYLFQWTLGGKMPGLAGLPKLPEPFRYPVSGDGWWSNLHFKGGGRFYSYHRDRTKSWIPWSIETNLPDGSRNPEYITDFHFNNGNWYDVIQRDVMNTFTDGVPNYDGIREVWVDGRLIYKKTDMRFIQDNSSTYYIDALNLFSFYGGDDVIPYTPNATTYTYIDSITLYRPLNDNTWVPKTAHSNSEVISSPTAITVKTLKYDNFVNTQTTVQNSEFPSTYSACVDETFLIDAGAGNKVRFDVSSGSIGNGDWIIFIDGNETDDSVISATAGYDSDLSNNTYTGSGYAESTDRYLYIMFKSDKEGFGIGFEGSTTFSAQ